MNDPFLHECFEQHAAHFWYFFPLFHEVISAIQTATKTCGKGALCECSRDRAITQTRTENVLFVAQWAEEGAGLVCAPLLRQGLGVRQVTRL